MNRVSASGNFSLPLRLVAALATFCFASPAADSDHQFDSASAAFEHGDLALAESLLRELVSTHPNDAPALGLLGAVLDSEKKLSEADSFYHRALRLTPNSPSLLDNYANHLLATGYRAHARTEYLKVVALDPARVNANLQLANFATDAGRGAEALHYLARIPADEQAAPQVLLLEMRALYLSHRDSEAGAAFARFSTAAAGDPRLLFTAGLALASVDRYMTAEDCFSRALTAAPADFDILYNLGLAAYHAGHLGRAREALGTALAQHPDDVDTLYNLATVDLGLKQRDAALALLVDAAKIDPARPNIQLSIAQTASALGFYADSLLAYDKYLKLVPGDLSARRERTFMDAVTSHPREGLAALEDFCRAHPGDATAHYEAGILQAKSDPVAAARHLDRAIHLDVDFTPARFGRGVLNLLQGDPAAALPDLKFAAAKYPDNSSVLDRLGECYTALNRTAEAVDALRKASQLAPRDSRVLMHLSRALAKAGQNDEARAVLARFRVNGPQAGNLIPQPGFLDLLSLSPAEQHARYRDEVEKRLVKDPQDPALHLRRLELSLDDGDQATAASEASQILATAPPAPIAAEAGAALVKAGLYSAAQPLLESASASVATPALALDLAVAISHTVSPAAGLARLDMVPPAQRSADFYLARAEMLVCAGRSAEARADIDSALAANSSADPRADLYEAAVTFLARQGQPLEGVRLLEASPAPLRDSAAILLLKARLLASANHVDEAGKIFLQIESRWPEWSPAYVAYTALLNATNRLVEARSQLDTALALGASGPTVAFLSIQLANRTPKAP